MAHNQSNGTAMKNFMDAMNDREKDSYLTNKDKSRKDLEEEMEGALRMNVYKLFLEARKEQDTARSTLVTAAPTPKVRFQNVGNYGNTNAGNYAAPQPMARSYQNNHAYGKSGTYTPNYAPTNLTSPMRMSQLSLNSNGSGGRDEQNYPVTINAQVAEYLNANGFAIARLLKEKFGVTMKAYPHNNRPGCTFAQFFGSISSDIGKAQDEMWLHLRSVQKSRIVLDNKYLCEMWTRWNPKNKNIFRNRTNSTVDTTDVEGELIIRAFNDGYLTKVQKILMEYNSQRLRPENDRELSMKMWGS